ncbi:MAG TPA: type II secretion system protein, partial [Thermomicrobiales bacterium]|nr:type II secretion system protein [Thermomicrobiales bacterium]
MRKRSGITVLEFLIVTIVIALLATLAYIRYGDVREEAYVVAMKNDLRNYAIAQYEYRSNHGSWGTEEIIQAKTWFDYSKDVFPDTATAYSTADAFYLRVYHKKTNRYCELEVLSKDSISATHDQIRCPGKDSNESATEPTLAAPTITPPPGFFVSANETYDAVFIVHNNSSLTRTFQLSVQSSNPDVVPTPPNPSAVTIAGRSSRSVTIHFTVSGDAVAGMASTLSLHAVDVEAPQLSGSGATQAIVASELMSPTVTAVSPAVVAAPGGSYSLDFVVVNNSNTTRSFEFMAISSDPSVVPNPANPPGQSIGAHAQVTVTVSVTVSASASDADLSNVTLVATDADAPELSGDASTAVQVVVVVENRPPTVSLSCPNQVTRSTLYSCTATFSDPDGNLSHTSWGALSVTS